MPCGWLRYRSLRCGHGFVYLLVSARVPPLLLLPILVSLLLCVGCRREANSDGAITFITDPGAKAFAVNERLVREFEAATRQEVRVIRGPADATERLSQYLQYLGAQSPDVDVYEIDVIWPAALENHLVDLRGGFMTTETAAFVPVIIENNTIKGRLLAMPCYVDLPLLYYRDDLLQKRGFSQPPQTWDELTTMAAMIQAAERASGVGSLWGYVWQGRAYEGLTCNALEWQVAEGGGRIISDGGNIQVNTGGAIRAVNRAAGWVGAISPPGVTMYAEEEVRQMFQSGNAVFMRNWPYAFSLVNGDESPVAGLVKTAPLPAGSGGRAAVLGGGQLAVSKYSRKKAAAMELVRYLTSARAQKMQAMESSRLPTRTALYDDPDIAKAFPFIPTMRDSLESAVARPSAQTGVDYNEVSTYYFQHMHRVLTGEATAAESLADLDELLRRVLRP